MRCVGLNQGYAIAYYNLAVVRSRQEAFATAIDAMEQFIRFSPERMVRQRQQARRLIQSWKEQR